MTLIGSTGGQSFTSQLLAQLQQAARPQGPQGPQAQVVPAADGTFTLQAGAGNDNIRIAKALNGMYGVSVNQQSFFFTKDQLAKLTIHAGDGDNQVAIDPSVDVPVMVKTGAGRDRIMNGASGAMIDTGAGEDQIYSRANNVKIHGGEGTDFVDSFGHQNELNGGLGNDLIRSKGNMNLLQGGDGNDALSSGGNNNFVRGGRGDDQIFAGGLQNRIDGFEGNNTIFAGGAGNVVDSLGGWDNIGVLGLNNVTNGQIQGGDLGSARAFLGLGPDAWTVDPRGVPQAFDPRDKTQAHPTGGLIAAGGAGAPSMFDALNVNPDLRKWTSNCGASGCCAWEPAIA